MKINIISFIVLLLICFTNVKALSEREIIDRALILHVGINIEKVSDTISMKQVDIQRSALAPYVTLFSTLSSNVENETMTSGLFGSDEIVIDGEKNTILSGVSFNQDFWYGISLEGSTSINKDVLWDNDSTTWGFNRNVSIEIPFIKNAWNYSDLNYSINKSKVERKLSIKNIHKNVLAKLTEVRKLYYEYVFWSKMEQHSLKAVAYYESLLDYSKVNFKSGNFIELDTINAKMNVLESEKIFKENKIKKEQFELILFELLKIQDLDTLGINLSDLNVYKNLEEKNTLNLALNNSLSIQINELEDKINKMNYSKSVNMLLPELNLIAEYSYDTKSEEFLESDLQYQKNAIVKLEFTYDFPNLSNYNSMKLNHYKKKRGRLYIKKKEEELSILIKKWFTTWKTNIDNVVFLNKLKETSSKQLSLGLEQYKFGELSRLELESIRNKYDTIEEELLTLRFQMKIMKIELEELDGTLIEYVKGRL